MYIWQFAFLPENSDEIYAIYGRTWEEYGIFCSYLTRALDESERLIIFVHNLSYEFQFLSGIGGLHSFCDSDSVFAVKPRKILKADAYKLEYRCSYLQTNMGLDILTKSMNVEHKKKSGEDFDYSAIRYPWTPLTDSELDYCMNDVIGLVESIKVRMESAGDTLATIPLTSTGYVRRDVKKVMYQYRFWQNDILPSYDVYCDLNAAFRGGDTHANRHYSGLILDNLTSFDRSSSYPDVCCNGRFPISKFQPLKTHDISNIVEEIYKKDRAVLMRVCFTNIRLKDDEQENPYLSKHKCLISEREEDELKATYDNGRVMTAPYLETTITDIDFRIISEVYDWDDVYVERAYYSRYGKLPYNLIQLFIKYYRDKTELKGIEGKEIMYMLAKALLNSIYGLMAQNPLKETTIYSARDYENMWRMEEMTEDEKKEKYTEAIEKSALPYQWGVWTTALARYELYKGMQYVKTHGGYLVYWDTDSIKYIGEVDWEGFNSEKIRLSTESGAYATDKHGITHYMGVFEEDGIYSKFKTMGAKKYCYVDAKDGKLHLTVSGVNKRYGVKELGSIDNFKEGFIFRKAGGTESVYNDRPEITEIEIDGHTLQITKNVVIKDSEYTLGITKEYSDLIFKNKYCNFGLPVL